MRHVEHKISHFHRPATKNLSIADDALSNTAGDKPVQAGLHPRTIAIEDSDRRPRAQANLFFHVFLLKSWKIVENGPIAPFDATGPSFTRAAYLRYRFPRHPSAFNGSPAAHGGRRHIRSHSSWTEPNPSGTSATSSSCTCRTTSETRAAARRTRAVPPSADNRAPRR